LVTSLVTPLEQLAGSYCCTRGAGARDLGVGAGSIACGGLRGCRGDECCDVLVWPVSEEG
jgi:hypothetical protein